MRKNIDLKENIAKNANIIDAYRTRHGRSTLLMFIGPAMEGKVNYMTLPQLSTMLKGIEDLTMYYWIDITSFHQKK
jgi:hypothetical protein